MARLNNRPSTLGGSRSATQTPAPDDTSDQENRDPSTLRRDKGKGRAMDEESRRTLPTPSSDESEETRGQKRKRVHLTQADDIPDDVDPTEKRFNRYFNPNQDPDLRRQVKKKSRALERRFNENRDEYLRGTGEGLSDAIDAANNIFKDVKQTNDATVDSRLFVSVSDIAYKKTAALVLGDANTGIDVNAFINKCINFMKNGGPGGEQPQTQTQTQRRRTQRREDSSDADDDDDIIGGHLDWEVLGRHACFPYNSRPACPSFLLGPLSVEKKVRKQTRRTARQLKDANAKEARPEALTRADLSQSDENGLTAVCTRIRQHLQGHINRVMKKASQTFSSNNELNSQRGRAWLKKHRLTKLQGPLLFDYVVNPQSFGQTVENLFYISFLIKEGHVGISADDEGMPVIVPSVPSDLEQQRRNKTVKQQAVFSLDYSTWQKLVEAFDVTEPMIPHRQEETATQVGSRGWYT